MTDHRRTAIRRVAGGQAITGGTLLLRPDLASASPCRSDRRSVPRWLVRLLGARILIQALVELAAPTPTVIRGGALVDVLHAASMLAIAARSSAYRPTALRSAAIASGSAAMLVTCAAPTRRSRRR